MTAFYVSPAGREMIERYEGLRLHAYRDIVGVWTIGYGHTGPDIGPGLVWTKVQADEALTNRLENEFGAAVNELCGASPTTQGQFDAMVSLAYNIGTGYVHHHAIPRHGFANTSVLRFHLAGDYDTAADAFLDYDHAGGIENEALATRRAEEGQMYADASPDA